MGIQTTTTAGKLSNLEMHIGVCVWRQGGGRGGKHSISLCRETENTELRAQSCYLCPLDWAKCYDLQRYGFPFKMNYWFILFKPNITEQLWNITVKGHDPCLKRIVSEKTFSFSQLGPMDSLTLVTVVKQGLKPIGTIFSLLMQRR